MAPHIITLKKPEWHDVVQEFRRALVFDYVKPRRPIPISSLLTLAHIESTSNSATRLLRDRDPLDNDGTTFTGSGPQVQMPFALTLLAHRTDAEISIPSLLKMTCAYDANNLSLDFISQLGTLFIVKPIWGEIQNYRFAPFQRLRRVKMSKSSLDFDLVDAVSPGETTSLSFELTI